MHPDRHSPMMDDLNLGMCQMNSSFKQNMDNMISETIELIRKDGNELPEHSEAILLNLTFDTKVFGKETIDNLVDEMLTDNLLLNMVKQLSILSVAKRAYNKFLESFSNTMLKMTGKKEIDNV